MIGVYIRVSTSKQETQAQRKAIRDWCKLKGYAPPDVAEYVDDGVSGKTLERPAFRALMTDIRSGKVRKLVTFELSRLSRNFLDLLEVMRAISEAGVVVEVPGEGSVHFESTMEQFVVAAKSLVAAHERERISARTKAGLAAAKARGVKLGAKRGEQRALGHRKDYASVEPELVAKVLKLHGRGLSTYAIAEVLGSEARPVSQSKVYRIIRRNAVSKEA